MTLLGPPLQELSLSDIQSFLDDADSEPLLWEAKGTEVDGHLVRKEVCGFANGRQTGFLILGASKKDGVWKLDGLDLGGDPPAWISDVIAGGLRPQPAVDVRSIEVDGGKHVAVVEVPPVAIAPCISRGTVYERVSGRTVPVKEPLRLAELYGRGDMARANASAAAADLSTELLQDRELPGADDSWPRVSIAVAATGQAPDISSVLFSRDFEAELARVVKEVLAPNPGGVPDPFGPQFRMGFEQSNRFVDCQDLHGHSRPIYWHVRAIWNGAVGIYATWEVDSAFAEHIAEILVTPAWQAAATLVEHLGGFGPSYSQILVDGKDALRGREGGSLGLARLNRGPTETSAAEGELRSVYRELRRATGQAIYEDDEAAD